MPSDILTTSSSSRPANGEYVIPFFAPDGLNRFAYSNPYWYMEDGWESIGPTEDEATFRIQAVSVNNYGFDIVLNEDGVLSVVKQDTPVIAVRYYLDDKGKSQYDVIWAGFVKTIRQKSEGSTQYVQVTATSVKKLLRDINVRGSYCWDGERVTYRDAVPLHMNHGGRPDWTFSDDGIPMPAPNPDWGLQTDEDVPDPEEQRSDAGTYCTLGMLLDYFKAAYSADGSGSDGFEKARDDAREKVTGLDRLPGVFPFNFIWPDAFGQEVDQQIVANFNNGVGQNNTSQGGARKGRDLRFQNGQPFVSNPGIMGVLDTVFAECGSYTWALNYGAIEANEDTDSSIDITINCVPTRLVDSSQAIPLYRAEGKESSIGASLVVREMDYLESCSGTYTRLAGVGSSVKIETRADTNDNGFLLGFSQAEFDQWRTDSVSGGNTSEDLMYKALKKQPHLFSRFLFDPRVNFATGTDYEDYPKGRTARPIWPFLLSYQGADLTTQANDIVPYPVRIEIDAIGDGTFVDAGIEADGFVSWDNGYFEFLALRDVGINRNDIPSKSKRTGLFSWTGGQWGKVTGGMLDVTLNNMRCTVAIPHDATLNYSTKTPADSKIKGDEQLYQNAPDSPDANRFDSRFTRTMIVDLSKLYDLWLRVGSYPVPESAGGAQADDRTGISNAVRSDYNLLIQAAQKSLYERNRLQRSGYFKYIGPIIPPQVYPLGQQISDIRSINPNTLSKPYFLNCCVQRKHWSTKNFGSPMQPKWSSSTMVFPI